jgi:hypothetical protein
MGESGSQLAKRPMIWFMLMQLFSILRQGVLLPRKSEREKDLEILLLRRQLAIVD